MASKARRLVTEEEFQEAAKAGLYALYILAKSAYGPKAGVAWVEAPYGAPLVSRDGVSNIDKLYLEEPVANMVVQAAKQASKANDQKVGDGTTAVAILSYHLYLAARKLIAGGHNRMEVSQFLSDMEQEAVDWVEKLKIEADTDTLKHVAAISSGDEAIGAMISDVIEEVGTEGGVTLQDSPGLTTYSEVVEGFYWPKGYTSVQLINDPASLEARYENVPILIAEKRLATVPDIAPILDKIVGAGRNELVIVGDVDQEALSVLLVARLQGKITTTVVDVPVYAGVRSLFLDDLALVTGGKVLAQGSNAEDFDLDTLGRGEKVVITGNSTSIIGREATKKEITARVTELTKQMEEAEYPSDREAIRTRLGRLTGKMAILHVGGATEVEQKEVKERVRDAVCAVQAAARGGVVPGGGVTLALAGAHSKDHYFDQALQMPFRDLVQNAGGNGEGYLAQLDSGKPWLGFNLKTRGSLTDLKKEGILDPALVVTETVQNAASVVRKIITGTVGLTYIDREARHE